jgi:tryptophan-rich sensory protein
MVSGGASDPWYAEVTKAPGTPPGYVFGIVWPILYVLIAIGGIILRRKVRLFEYAGTPFGLFFFQLTLNAAWSVLFFFFHRPVWSMIDLVALWITILAMMYEFSKRSKWAAAMFIPYLLWSSFAAYLNAGIIWLN